MIKRGEVINVGHLSEIRIYFPPSLFKGFIAPNQDTKIRVIRSRNSNYWDVRITSNSSMVTCWFESKNRYSIRVFMEKSTLQNYKDSQ